MAPISTVRERRDDVSQHPRDAKRHGKEGENVTVSLDEIRRLSVADRMDLLEAIWDSIADDSDILPLTESQRRELDARLDALARETPILSTWDEVRSRVERGG